MKLDANGNEVVDDTESSNSGADDNASTDSGGEKPASAAGV